MRRPRSLFWTIAGLFLLAVVVGTLLQALIATAVLRPLEARDQRARAELSASNIAVEIAALPGTPRAGTIDTLLAQRGSGLGPFPPWMVYRGRDGVIASAPPDLARYLPHLLAGDGIPDLAPPGLAPPDRRHPGQRGRLEPVARRTIVRGSEVLGEILMVRPVRPVGALGFRGTRTTLLSFPIAALLSIGVGLVMLRLLVRRLRALELLAARVAEGDLGVRIADTSGDEIGRLAERLDRMAERLAEAQSRIEATERQRRQLFADITHELATPLTSVRGYAETLLDPGVTVSAEERTRYVRGVLEESRRLDRMIRDLFDLARLEAGAAPLEKERLDWAALCRNTLERFEPRFREAGLTLAWKPGTEEAWIEADGHRMEEVLENLLGNALRYVPVGGRVELALARGDRFAGGFRLTVSDDGPGLPAEELPHVFERFYRGTAARTAGGVRDNVGSGLGLAILREIVERHGGTARAETRAPHGVSFVIELPAKG
jgi:signal transduction histidine kinase